MTTQVCYNYYKYPINFFSNNPVENALFRAIAENNLKKVMEEINSGINIDCRMNLDKNWTPLLMAFSLARKEIFCFLLEKGADREAVLNDGRYIVGDGRNSMITEANHELSTILI